MLSFAIGIYLVSATVGAVLGALTENDLRGLNTVMNTFQVLGLALIAAYAPKWLRDVKKEIKADNAERTEEIKTAIEESHI